MEAIHGVDIDAQAVEVTRLSLLLKMLEGESAESLASTGLLDRILPDLDRTIRCGNALVGPEIIDDEWWNLLGTQREHIRPFDWHTAFPTIFREGGFDCVIGNPPYINLKRGFLSDFEKQFFEKTYRTAQGQYDAFALFVERSFFLLKESGRQAFILPKPVLASESYEEVRALYLERSLQSIIDCASPFADAAVEAVIIISQNSSVLDDTVVQLQSKQNDWGTELVPQKAFSSLPSQAFSYLLTHKNWTLISRLLTMPNLRVCTSLFTRGIEAGKRQTDSVQKGKRLLRGEDVSRYRIVDAQLKYQPTESNRREWKSKDIYDVHQKILIRRVADRIIASLDTDQHWTLNTLYTLVPQKQYSIAGLLGVLNSKLLSFVYRVAFLGDDKLFPYLRIAQLELLPIPEQLGDGTPEVKHIELLVERQIDLHRRYTDTQHKAELESIAGAIAATDRAIDRIVYDLYGLTEEEIALVERR